MAAILHILLPITLKLRQIEMWFQCLPPHVRGQGIQQNHQFQLLVSAILDSKMAAVLNLIACKLRSKADRNKIPTANPTFSGSRNPAKMLFWTSDVGNGIWGMKWSRDRWRHVTLKGQGRDPDIFGCKYLENGSRRRLGINGSPVGKGMWQIDWSRDRWRHVTDDVTWPRNVKSWPQYVCGPLSRQ